MEKQFRIVQLVVFISILLILNFLLLGKYKLPTGDISIWFHAGLLMLIIGNYWIEKHFTKPTNVVVNCIIVFISVSTLNNPPFNQWWLILRYFSLFLVIFSLIIIWFGSPSLPQYDTSKFKKFIYKFTIGFGNAKVIFSFVFILSILSYYDLRNFNVKLLVIFWGIVLGAKHIGIESVLDLLFSFKSYKKSNVVGSIKRFAEPNIVRFSLYKEAICRKGDIVALTEDGYLKNNSPIGIVISHRKTVDNVEAEAIIIDSPTKEGEFDKNIYLIKTDNDDDILKNRIEDNNNFSKLNSLIGIVAKNTEISELYFELIKKPEIEEGHLVSVYDTKTTEILYQIINAKIHEEITFETCERAYTVGYAHQLGTWSRERQGFDTYNWIVPENSPVYHLSESAKIEIQLKENIMDVGRIPNSTYPVNINIKELVTFHCALLGVTGSGKTFLAYHLIESCSNNNIKTICLDVTGDYKRYLNNTVLLNRKGAVQEFLNQEHYKIGIVEFNEKDIHPIKAANAIANKALKWCMEHRTKEEIKEPTPKVLLVLEEAHVLVPEWNFNPKRDLQDVVSHTA